MSISKHSIVNTATKVASIYINSPLFKNTLAQISDPPKKLFYRGNIDLLQKNQGNVLVAVVGSRRVTPYGQLVTHRLATELAKRGIVVVSGLALGVDSIAHRAALGADGPTIVVLPSGIEKIYPASHKQLAEKIIAQGGLLVSEYHGMAAPHPYQFIARNRLISGISSAVVITEAAKKSGSLHTADFALDQGKLVLAVPGNITSPNSVGTNNLIKNGAIPVTGIADILDSLHLDNHQLNLILTGDTPQEEIILQLMQAGHHQTEKLQRLSKLPVSLFNQTLTMLEISGKIRSQGANQWVLN